MSATADPEAQERQRRAARIYAEGQQAYAEGSFDQAAMLMRRAYELHPEPILLYNTGRALQAAGDFEGAVDYLQRYLASPGELSRRSLAEAHLATTRRLLEQRQAEAEAAERGRQEEAAEQERERERERELRETRRAPRSVEPTPWVLMGVGIAAVGAGIGLGVVALDRESQVVQEPEFEAAERMLGEAETLGIAATVAYAAGGVLAGIGLVWGIVDLSSGGSDERVEVSFGPGSLHVRGQF